jgi:PilZ domain
MPATTLAPQRAVELPRGMECRVYERFSCDIPTTCQPIAARSDKDITWPASIRDVSEGGVGLILARRFERGAGLAIELPGSGDRPAETLLAKVVHTTRLPDNRWLLGCSFISKLSEDEVRFVVELAEALRGGAAGVKESSGVPVEQASQSPATAPPAPASDSKPTSPAAASGPSPLMSDMWFEGITHDGQTVRVPVRHLLLKGNWPLPVGTTLRLWAGDRSTNPAGILVKVMECREQSDGWTLKYRPIQPVSADVLRKLGFSG